MTSKSNVYATTDDNDDKNPRYFKYLKNFFLFFAGKFFKILKSNHLKSLNSVTYIHI